MTNKEANLMICKIESSLLKRFLSQQPYGEPHRIKVEVMNLMGIPTGKAPASIEARKSALRRFNNWTQGQCRIPYDAKMAINEVVGFTLLFPYNDYTDVIRQMDDNMLFEHLQKHRDWQTEAANYCGVDVKTFFPYLSEFIVTCNSRGTTHRDVDDCIQHFFNWLKKVKGVYYMNGDTPLPPKPYKGVVAH